MFIDNIESEKVVKLQSYSRTEKQGMEIHVHLKLCNDYTKFLCQLNGWKT